jgi:hypothetical protein
MATRKRAKKKGRKTARKRSGGNIMLKASRDKTYRAAKKRAAAAVKKAGMAYRAAVKRAKKARK